jgi:hypothetical protein
VSANGWLGYTAAWAPRPDPRGGSFRSDQRDVPPTRVPKTFTFPNLQIDSIKVKTRDFHQSKKIMDSVESRSNLDGQSVDSMEPRGLHGLARVDFGLMVRLDLP